MLQVRLRKAPLPAHSEGRLQFNGGRAPRSFNGVVSSYDEPNVNYPYHHPPSASVLLRMFPSFLTLPYTLGIFYMSTRCVMNVTMIASFPGMNSQLEDMECNFEFGRIEIKFTSSYEKMSCSC